MEEEQNPQQHAAIAREELIAIIKATFSANNHQQQQLAQQKIQALLKTDGFMQRLFTVLSEPGDVYLKSNLDLAVASLIKKFAYDIAKSNQDQSKFIQTLVKLILNENVNFKAKELLGTALEYQFIEDQDDRYRKTIIMNVLNAMLVRENLLHFQGLIIICIAYLNSLDQVQAQIEFFLSSLQNLCFTSGSFLSQVLKLTQEEFTAKGKLIIFKIHKLFEYVEIIVERMRDEEMYLMTELKQFRQNKFLIAILENYLPLFGNNGSIISVKCPAVNETKRIMSNITTQLYSNYTCPPTIFNAIYITFLVESQFINRDSVTQSILIGCMQLLSLHLQKKYYYKLFADNIEQTILALFMYSTTSQQEYEALDNNPEQFSDIAECYVVGDQKYYNLKVKAGILVQTLALKVDGALRQMLQILIVILASSLQRSEGDSQIMMEIKEQTSKFDFYGLTREKKLQTSLMMLSTISSFANRRNDVSQIIYSLFITQYEVFSKINTPIVVLRLLRCVACYPSALYYSYIQQQIKKGRVFALEGLRCFEKMIKTNKYHELFKNLALIIANVMEFVSVTDPIMDLIVNKQFQQMLKASSSLFEGILRKISSQFYANMQYGQHETLTCFNLLYSLLSKEIQPEQLNKILSVFYEWLNFLQLPQNINLYHKYDQKIVQIFEYIITKYSQTNEQVDQFVKHTLASIQSVQKGSQFFRFYSIYIYHSAGSQNKLEVLFVAFFNELKRRFMNFENRQPYNEGINYFSFLISSIISNYCKISISQNDLTLLLKMAEKLPQGYKQYPLIVFLTHLYQHPYPTRAFLNQNGFYTGFLNEVVKVNFENGIIKKIFILSMIKLLQIEDNIDNFRLILINCIRHLKRQVSLNKTADRIVKLQPRIRPLTVQKTIQNSKQEHIENDNEMVDMFVKFKHALDKQSDFDQFKVIFWQNDHMANQLGPEIKADLKLILETQWVENKTRRIVHVKK